MGTLDGGKELREWSLCLGGVKLGVVGVGAVIRNGGEEDLVGGGKID